MSTAADGETEIARVQKQNFNLKLRIYYLEEVDCVSQYCATLIPLYVPLRLWRAAFGFLTAKTVLCLLEHFRGFSSITPSC